MPDARRSFASGTERFTSMAGAAASGPCRLVDPISHAATEMPLDGLTRETAAKRC